MNAFLVGYRLGIVKSGLRLVPPMVKNIAEILRKPIMDFLSRAPVAGEARSAPEKVLDAVRDTAVRVLRPPAGGTPGPRPPVLPYAPERPEPPIAVHDRLPERVPMTPEAKLPDLSAVARAIKPGRKVELPPWAKAVTTIFRRTHPEQAERASETLGAVDVEELRRVLPGRSDVTRRYWLAHPWLRPLVTSPSTWRLSWPLLFPAAAQTARKATGDVRMVGAHYGKISDILKDPRVSEDAAYLVDSMRGKVGGGERVDPHHIKEFIDRLLTNPKLSYENIPNVISNAARMVRAIDVPRSRTARKIRDMLGWTPGALLSSLLAPRFEDTLRDVAVEHLPAELAKEDSPLLRGLELGIKYREEIPAAVRTAFFAKLLSGLYGSGKAISAGAPGAASGMLLQLGVPLAAAGVIKGTSGFETPSLERYNPIENPLAAGARAQFWDTAFQPSVHRRVSDLPAAALPKEETLPLVGPLLRPVLDRIRRLLYGRAHDSLQYFPTSELKPLPQTEIRQAPVSIDELNRMLRRYKPGDPIYKAIMEEIKKQKPRRKF